MNASTDATTSGRLQAAADLGDAVALLDLEGDLAAARARVVVGRAELVLDLVDPGGDAPVGRRRPARPGSPARSGSPGRGDGCRSRAPTSGRRSRSAPRGGPPCRSWSVRSLDDLSRRGAAGSFGVQRVLQDHHGGGLVDHRSPLGPLAASVAQHSLRGHRGQPLVGQPHRHRRHRPGQAGGPLAHLRGGRPLAAGQRARQPDDHLEHPLGSPSCSSTSSSAIRARSPRPRWHGLDRGRQHPGRVAAGHPDPRVTGVDAQPTP